MYFSNPIEQSAAGFVRVSTFTAIIESPDQNRNVKFASSSPPDNTLTRAVLFVLRIAHGNRMRALCKCEVEAKSCTCTEVRTLQPNGSVLLSAGQNMTTGQQ